jgi:amino acid transporter
VAAGPLLDRWFGVDLSWWLIALGCWLVVGALGVLNIDINKRVLAVLLLAEVAILLVYGVADLLNPTDGSISFVALSPVHLLAAGFGSSLGLAFLGYVGFGAAVVLTQHAKDPVRTLRRATYGSIVSIGVLYAFSSWAMTVAVGTGRIVAVSTEQGTQLIFNLAGSYLGQAAMDLGMTLFATSILAAMISFHNLTARYMYALGLEGVLPSWLARTGLTKAPWAASLTQTCIAFAVICLYAVAGWDPVVHLFYWGGTIGGVGVLVLLLLTSISVIGYFARDRRGESAWRAVIAPAAASTLLAVMTYLVFDSLSTLLGVPAGHRLVWIVRGGFLVALLVGAGYGLVLKARRPAAYAVIGLGADAATAPAIPAPRTGAHSADRQEASTR